MPSLTVAVIGGGIAGICSARCCLEEGLSPTLFEATSSAGGLWSQSDDNTAGVFDNLTTNIPFYESITTDLPPLRKAPNPAHGADASLFLSAKEWYEYLQHVIASTPGLADCVRVNSRVTAVRRVGDRYAVTVASDGATRTTEYDRVVVATGRNQRPLFPEVRGIEHFRGRVMHAKDYRNPRQFDGERVLVVGGSISGSECAGDLGDSALGQGPSKVTFITRKMKHWCLKQRDERSYTRVQLNLLRALSIRAGVTSVGEEHVRMRPELEELYSRNEDYGLAPPATDTLLYVVSARFLRAAKAKTKLDVRVTSVEEVLEDGTVCLADGSVNQFDTIIFATGYDLSLPMFDAEICNMLFTPEADRIAGIPELDLYSETWHPHLPGCAFVGQFIIFGSALMFLDMQARWVARAFADVDITPTDEEMRAGVRERVLMRKQPGYIPAEFVAPILYEWARRTGCEIDYTRYPELTKCLLVGPTVPAQFRLCGHGAVEDPVRAYRDAVRLSGIDVDDVQVSEGQLQLLKECLRGFKARGYVPPGFEKAVCDLEQELAAKG